MKTSELIKEIQRLPIQKRIFVIEKSIHSLRVHDDSTQMKKAAAALFTDYSADKELISFSNIDFEDFYEAR